MHTLYCTVQYCSMLNTTGSMLYSTGQCTHTIQYSTGPQLAQCPYLPGSPWRSRTQEYVLGGRVPGISSTGIPVLY